MKMSKDKLKQRVLENIKATKRKRQIQAAIEEILANPEQEILDEKSKRGRAQRKKARAQAKKEKAKAAKAEQAQGEEAPAADAPAGDAPAGDAPAPEGEKPKAGGPSAGGLKAFAAGMMKDPKKAMNQLGKDTKQYLKDNPEVAKELTAAMEAGQNAKVEDLLGGLPGQDALIDAGEKIASGDVEGLEGVGAAAGAALAGGYGVEAAQLLGGAAGMALNNFADVTKNAETLAGTIIPQLSTLSKFLLDSDAADLKKVGAELKGLNKMFDEKLGFLMKASEKKAKEGGEQPTGGAAAAADVPPELTDEQKADMSPEEIKAYEEKRQGAIQATQRTVGGGAAAPTGGSPAEKEAMQMTPEKEAQLKKALQKEKDPAKKRALSQVLKARGQVNKLNGVANALMQRDKSAFGKTATAKLDAPDEYYWKKYGPHLDRLLSFKLKKANSNVRVRKEVADTMYTRSPERLIAPGVINGREMLNPEEKKELGVFANKIANIDDKNFETWIKSPKMQSAWEEQSKLQMAAEKKAQGTVGNQTDFASLYDPKTGELTPLAAQVAAGDVPSWYSLPKGFDPSKYKDLGQAKAAPAAKPAEKPEAKEEPKK